MNRIIWAIALLLLSGAAVQASIINTNTPGTVAAFQSGATVIDFSSVSGVTPLSITSYTSGVAVPNAATVFNQISGVQLSVGGMVGTNRPAVYSLGGTIAGDAKSPPNVLGPVDFSFNTLFGAGAMMEMFFPTKVDRVGFWLNPSLGNVLIIAADTNFAFSGLPETTLESGNVTAGNFVGIQRAAADIGGFKIIGLGNNGFTIDDLTFKAGAVVATPEPSTFVLIGTGLLALAVLRRRETKAIR
jgi:PEP-CTERM motif